MRTAPRRPRPHSSRPANVPQAPLLVVFIPAGNTGLAALYPPPTIVIPVTGQLTVDRLIGELRNRPNAAGMQYLEINPAVPIQVLLREAPRLFRELCPFLAPSGTRITMAYGPGMPTAAQLQFHVSGRCSRAILYSP
jgi:hypothetical protein